MKPINRIKKTAYRNLISLSLLFVTVLSACNMLSQTEAAPDNPTPPASEPAVTEDLPTTAPTVEETVVNADQHDRTDPRRPRSR